jgi:hypothetical protein
MFGRRKRPTRDWVWKERHTLEVKHAGASRALYGDSIQTMRVAFQVHTTDDQVVEFELSVDEAAHLLRDMTSAYTAIVPAPPSRGGGGGV